MNDINIIHYIKNSYHNNNSYDYNGGINFKYKNKNKE